jgi:hypothetical protein
MRTLKVIGLLGGLVAGVLTIITFFSSPGAGSLLQSLGEVIPAATGFLNNVDSAVTRFAEASPMGPAVTASLLFIIIIAVRLLAEVVFELISTEFTVGDVSIHALGFLPLALAWIWVFSGVVGGLGIGIFLAAYVAVTVISTGISANYKEIVSAISGVWNSLRTRVSRRSNGSHDDW